MASGVFFALRPVAAGGPQPSQLADAPGRERTAVIGTRGQHDGTGGCVIGLAKAIVCHSKVHWSALRKL